MMLKRFLSVFLLLFFLSGTASAENTGMTVTFSIREQGTDTSVCFDADYSEDQFRILSDLFPSYYVSIPAEGFKGFLTAETAESGFPVFSLPNDISAIIEESFSGLDCREMTGIYSGDAFTEAYSVREGYCDCAFLLSFMDRITDGCNYLSSLISGLSTLSGTELPSFPVLFRVYDSGSYLSLTGLLNGDAVFTLSADFSDSKHCRIVWGYPENGHNYYWQIDFDSVSDEEICISTAFFPDREKSGFRNASFSEPVLREEWTFSLSADHRELTFNAAIKPSDEKSTVSLKGNSTPYNDCILNTELFFANNPDIIYTLSVRGRINRNDYSNLKQVSSTDPGDSASVLGFTGEVSMRILSIYTALIRSLPDQYKQLLLNLY